MYVKMLGFYFFEFIGSAVNLLCSLFRRYPALDLGVQYLLNREGSRVVQQNDDQDKKRNDLEKKASTLKTKAYDE